MEKEGIAKSIPKKKQLRAPNVIVTLHSFSKTVWILQLESVFGTICASGARNMERSLVKCILGPQADSSLHVEMLVVLRLEVKVAELTHRRAH